MWEQFFTSQEITPLEICHKTLSIISPATVEIFFSHVHLFLDVLLNLGHFGHVVPAPTKFLKNFLGSKKVGTIMNI